jgi:hypothetical protein
MNLFDFLRGERPATREAAWHAACAITLEPSLCPENRIAIGAPAHSPRTRERAA